MEMRESGCCSMNAGGCCRQLYLIFLLTLFVYGSLIFMGGFFQTSQYLPEATKHDGDLIMDTLTIPSRK